ARMGGGLVRNPLALLPLLGLILVGLSLTAGGCDTEAAGVKSVVKAYYDAVAQGDGQEQVALWVPDRRENATREAEAWARRDKEGLNLTEVHVDSGPAGDQRIVHVTLSIEDKARTGKRRYESRVLLMQLVDGKWLIRDVR
ncbi:MAG: hypothetical protein Q8P59_00090, partial [Dehalococcoidia bacterium]|nr:hypothetical protein [Dehalococcoidia bacterium]